MYIQLYHRGQNYGRGELWRVKRVQLPQQTKTRKTVTFPKTVTRNQAFQKTVTLIVTVTKFLFKTVTFP